LASSDAERGVAAGGIPFAQKGIELTRSFRALKVWMNLKAYGVSHFAKLIEQNIEQAQYLVGLIEKHPKLQMMGVAPLNVACFRYYDDGLSEQELNALNHEILLRSQEGGKFVLSSTEIDGGFALRFCNTNHRTTLSYMDSIIAEIPRLAEEILSLK
ncbi:MAG: pyridoxal-dependent decarboxylase, partial [Parvibaculales bacterium]